MAKFRVELDKATCQGFGACVELCPQFFQLSDIDGTSRIEGGTTVTNENGVVAETVELDDLECVKEAAEACPFNALHIVNVETDEKLI
jgi:ferredoxin